MKEVATDATNYTEIILLGGMILDSDALELVIAKITGDCFQSHAHLLIFRQICKLHTAGQPVDFISVTDSLRFDGLLEEVGGSSYIMKLVHSIPTTANFDTYATRLIEAAKQRREGGEVVDLSLERLDEIRQRHGRARAGKWDLWVWGGGDLMHKTEPQYTLVHVSADDWEFMNHASSDMAYLLHEMSKDRAKLNKIREKMDTHGITSSDLYGGIREVLKGE